MATSTSRLPLSLALSAALGVAFAPASAQAARVLLVSDSGADLDIAPVLSGDGHEVVVATSDFAIGNATLRGDLSGYDLVVWSATGPGSGDVHPDSGVFANLAEFVRQGGRVLVTGYDSVASPTDPLLIEFLGATGSTDVPPPPGPVSGSETSLTVGVVDIRGVVPSPTSGDRDTLTGLHGDTVEIVGTSGGGGSQWTLRRFGDGEIAYVSNGDSGGSTSSWSTRSSDGTGAYNAALRNFAAAARGGASIRRVAAHGSPRRAHAMYLLEAPSPAVLIGPDRAWIPSGAAVPLSICGPACHPVIDSRECSPPECPGTGTLLIAGERVADVPDFPRDRDGWNRERAMLAADAELASLAWAYGVHPEPPPAPPRPVRFLRSAGSRLGFEVHAAGSAGILARSGIAVGGISASLGLRFQPRDLEEPLDVIWGNVLGVDLRATVLPGVTGQSAEDLAVLVGIAPAYSYAFDDDRVRIPPALGLIMPEVGLAVSTSRPLTYYLAWHLDAAVLLDEHVGLDVRLDFVLLDEWVDGDDVEAIVSLGAGIFFR